MNAFDNVNHLEVGNDAEFNNVGRDYNQIRIYQGATGEETPYYKVLRLLLAIEGSPRRGEIKSGLSIQSLKKIGNWLLVHPTYIGWKTGVSPSRLLWLMGIPGAGKTVLCSRVIYDIKKDREVVLVYHCDKEVKKSDPKEVLASLLRQLLEGISPDSPGLSKFSRQHEPAQGIDEDHLIQLIQELSYETKNTFIILDGLEECGDVGTIVQYLNELIESERIRVLVSSRDHPIIRGEFQASEKITIYEDNIADDMRQYVDGELKEVKVIGAKLRKAIINNLVSGAQGTFIWPVCHVEQLRRVKSEHDVKGILASIPRGMTQIFTSALETIRAQPHSDILRSVLQLIICAQHPIPPCALGEAISILSEGWARDAPPLPFDPMALINDCSGLLICIPATREVLRRHSRLGRVDAESSNNIILSDDDVVVPLHSSLETFLLEDPMALATYLATRKVQSLADIHGRLTMLCLAHLSSALKGVVPEYELACNHRPLTEYAVLAWPAHLRESRKGLAEYEDFFSVWRCNKTKKWIPNPAHMAVRLNLTVRRGFTPDMLAEKDEEGLSPLHVAMKKSVSLSVIDSLLKQANVNQISDDHHAATALHLAAMYHRKPEEVMQRLLKAGGDANATARGGLTPLHVLLEWRSLEDTLSCVPLLLEHGADINAQDEYSRTPLHVLARCATQSESARDILELLCNRGANVDVRDQSGKAPLHWAAACGYASFATALLKKGADVHATDSLGDTPLAMAIRANRTEKITPHGVIIQVLRGYGTKTDIAQQQNLLHDDENSDNSDMNVERLLCWDPDRTLSDLRAQSQVASDLEKELAKVKREGAESNERFISELASCKLQFIRQTDLVASLRQDLERAQSDLQAKSQAASRLEKELERAKKEGTESNERLISMLASWKLEFTRQTGLESVQSNLQAKSQVANHPELARAKEEGAESSQRLVVERVSSKQEVKQQTDAITSLHQRLTEAESDFRAKIETADRLEKELETVKDGAESHQRLAEELESCEQDIKQQTDVINSLRERLKTAKLNTAAKSKGEKYSDIESTGAKGINDPNAKIQDSEGILPERQLRDRRVLRFYPFPSTKIFVKLAGETITLEVEKSDTIAKVKAKIRNRARIFSGSLQLTFAGTELENRHRLSYYNIQGGSTLHLDVGM